METLSPPYPSAFLYHYFGSPAFKPPLSMVFCFFFKCETLSPPPEPVEFSYKSYSISFKTREILFNCYGSHASTSNSGIFFVVKQHFFKFTKKNSECTSIWCIESRQDHLPVYAGILSCDIFNNKLTCDVAPSETVKNKLKGRWHGIKEAFFSFKQPWIGSW